MLTELDGIEELKGVVVLAATNRIDLLDPALLRPGRLEFHVELPMPDAEARRAILKVHMRACRSPRTWTSKNWCSNTEGFVGADLEGLCRQAAMLAIREFVEPAAIKAPRAGEKAAAERKTELLRKLVITKKHFETALAERNVTRSAP